MAVIRRVVEAPLLWAAGVLGFVQGVVEGHRMGHVECADVTCRHSRALHLGLDGCCRGVYEEVDTLGVHPCDCMEFRT